MELCRKLGSNSTRVSEIAGGRDRVIYTAIQEGINRVNEKAASNAQRIQKWTVLENDFSIPGGELGKFPSNSLFVAFVSNYVDLKSV